MRHERYRAVDACLLQPQARRILAARTPGNEIQTESFDASACAKPSAWLSVWAQMRISKDIIGNSL
jgi:hypothetical protein